jgi:glycosyltransferase involved in cell wall biosynthesis
MKVVNIVEEARWGGPQVRITNVASTLKRYQVYTIVLHPSLDSDRLVEELCRLNIEREEREIYRLTRDVPILSRYFIFFFREILEMVDVLKETDPDIVHCNGASQIKGMLAASLVGVPAIWHLNDTQTLDTIKVIFRSVAQFAADGFIFASKRTRNYYLTNSNYLTSTNLSSLPSKVVQAPVDTEEFDPDSVQQHLRLSGLDGLKVVTVATVNPLKGIGDFIDMAEKIHHQVDRDVHFFIVGPIHDSQKKYCRRLQSRAEDSACDIRFTGHSDEVPQILNAADVYVCSSKFEASPISVWEAMAMKLPVVATNVGDLRQFLEDSNRPAGSVVEVGDSSTLAKKVLRLLEDRQLRKQYGENARKIAQDELSLEICTRKHAEIYKQIIRRQSL